MNRQDKTWNGRWRILALVTAFTIGVVTLTNAQESKRIVAEIQADIDKLQVELKEAMAIPGVLRLDENNEQAWRHMLMLLNNKALEFADEKQGYRYDLAAIILDQGVALDPTYANFRTNQVYVFYRWIFDLAKKGHFDGARKVYVLAEKRLPDNEVLRKLIDEVNRAESQIP